MRADSSQSVSAWQQSAESLLNIAKIYYSSSEPYKEIYRRITGDMEQYKAQLGGALIDAQAAAQATRDNDLSRLKNTLESIAQFAEANFQKLADQLSREYLVLQQIAQQLGKLNDVTRLLAELPPELAALLKSITPPPNTQTTPNQPKPQNPQNALGEVKWVKTGEFDVLPSLKRGDSYGAHGGAKLR